LPPWVKDYSRNAFPYLSVGSAGLLLLGNLHPGVKVAGLGVAFAAVVAKVLADDPIDCSSAEIASPQLLYTPMISSNYDPDPISLLSNEIGTTGTHAFSVAKAAVTNANRAACNDFSDEQRAALFTAAQTQAGEVGNDIALLKIQLGELATLLEERGIVLDELRDVAHRLEDWWFNFVDPNFADPAVDSLFLQVLSADELDDYKDGALGVALFDYQNGNFMPIYPDIWPDGVRWMFPVLDQWSASLVAKEAGQ
jgi:hypothetical protein